MPDAKVGDSGSSDGPFRYCVLDRSPAFQSHLFIGLRAMNQVKVAVVLRQPSCLYKRLV